MSASPWVIDVSEAAFMKEVVERSREVPVVVDFWATWCGPCRQLGPMLEQLAQERQGAFILAKVDVDRAQTLAMQLQIRSVPFVLAFVDGRPGPEFVGVLPKPELERWLDKVCPEPPPATGVDGALETADPAAAEAKYRALLEEEPKHVEANLGLARLALARGEGAEVLSLLEALDGAEKDHAAEDEIDRLKAVVALRELASACGDPAEVRSRQAAAPDDPQAGYQLGCVLAAEEAYEEALAALLAAGKLDRQLVKNEVRAAMVHVFYAIGARSELSDRYRDELANLVH